MIRSRPDSNATTSIDDFVRFRAEVCELCLERIRPQQPDAGAALGSRLGQQEAPAVREREREHRRLRTLLVRVQVAQAPRAHQVHHQHELAVVGREEEALRASARTFESLTLEHGQRRVEGLERGDVRRAGLRDRVALDVRLELASPGLDLGEFGQRTLLAWVHSG